MEILGLDGNIRHLKQILKLFTYKILPGMDNFFLLGESNGEKLMYPVLSQ